MQNIVTKTYKDTHQVKMRMLTETEADPTREEQTHTNKQNKSAG